jgi:hypothetical protein
MRRGTKTETVRVTAKGQGAIRRARGILKRKPGGKSFAEEWAGHKQEERELEDAKGFATRGHKKSQKGQPTQDSTNQSILKS